MKIWFIPLAAIMMLGASCSSTDDGDEDSGVDIGAVDASLTPSAVCDKYLLCVQEAKPSDFQDELKLFGAKGPCWKSDADKANCEKLCKSEYDKLALKYTKMKNCGGIPVDAGADVGAKSLTGSQCQGKEYCVGDKCLKDLTDDGKTKPTPAGYCSRDCTTALCQTGEACFSQTTKTGKVLSKDCLKICVTPSDCRTSEGYTCSSDKVCVPGVVPDAGADMP